MKIHLCNSTLNKVRNSLEFSSFHCGFQKLIAGIFPAYISRENEFSSFLYIYMGKPENPKLIFFGRETIRIRSPCGKYVGIKIFIATSLET